MRRRGRGPNIVVPDGIPRLAAAASVCLASKHRALGLSPLSVLSQSPWHVCPPPVLAGAFSQNPCQVDWPLSALAATCASALPRGRFCLGPACPLGWGVDSCGDLHLFQLRVGA